MTVTVCLAVCKCWLAFLISTQLWFPLIQLLSSPSPIFWCESEGSTRWKMSLATSGLGCFQWRHSGHLYWVLGKLSIFHKGHQPSCHGKTHCGRLCVCPYVQNPAACVIEQSHLLVDEINLGSLKHSDAS